MKAFVTGATGYIGGAIRQALTAEAWAVTSVGRPALHQEERFDLAVLAHGPSPQKQLDVIPAIASVANTIELVEQLEISKLLIFILSSAAFKGSYDPSYAASRAALLGLIPTYAKKLKCRVVGIAPGLVKDSPICNSMIRSRREEHKSQMRGGMLDVCDIAKTVLWLCDTPSVHNTVISLDGGYRR